MKGSSINGKPVMMVFFVMVFSTAFQFCSSSTNQLPDSMMVQTKPHNRSSVFFDVSGSVSDGFYSVTLEVGSSPKPYTFDIDTGSDLTWVQCDAPCLNCYPAPHEPYKPPSMETYILCKSPCCEFVQKPPDHPCSDANDRCHYMLEYADQGSSIGMLVRDSFPLHFDSGLSTPSLTFGCGFDQKYPPSMKPLHVDGVLGLANGKLGFVSQLRAQGLVQNVFGHCFGSLGDGYLFFGDDISPSPGTVWMPMAKPSESEHYYSPGQADLLFDGELTSVEKLDIFLDTGSTYTYFTTQAYAAALSLVKKNLKETPLISVKDTFLPVCWKGPNPFNSIDDVQNYFKPFALIFSKFNNVQLHLPPQAYLIISELGNVCLGIFNGNEAGLGSWNIIGDISLQDMLVIYDNERELIGWTTSNCTTKADIHDYSKGLPLNT